MTGEDGQVRRSWNGPQVPARSSGVLVGSSLASLSLWIQICLPLYAMFLPKQLSTDLQDALATTIVLHTTLFLIKELTS